MTIDTVGLTYDALGRMVEQNRAGVYTQILYSPVGKTAIMSGQTRKTINLPLPGGATAVYDTTFHYRYSDWLGSSRFSSTTSRTKFSDDAYAPYGENYAESGTVDPSFIGNDQDTVPGTYDFLFREYKPFAAVLVLLRSKVATVLSSPQKPFPPTTGQRPR